MAISNPKSERDQDVAWQAVCPSVLLLRKFYEFALELETALCDLLTVLCSPGMAALQHLEQQQMTSPAIQNDFSYYRRTLNRRRMEEASVVAPPTDGVDLPDDVANRMSLFYANPTPMLHTLSGAAEKLLQENPSLTLENMTNCFSAMASVCRVINENQQYSSRFKNEETQLFCLRVMVGVIILYDHVHPVGAFSVKAAIDMKSSIKLIKEHPKIAESLLNALRYSTKHFNEDSTPKATKDLLS